MALQLQTHVVRQTLELLAHKKRQRIVAIILLLVSGIWMPAKFVQTVHEHARWRNAWPDQHRGCILNTRHVRWMCVENYKRTLLHCKSSDLLRKNQRKCLRTNRTKLWSPRIFEKEQFLCRSHTWDRSLVPEHFICHAASPSTGVSNQSNPLRLVAIARPFVMITIWCCKGVSIVKNSPRCKLHYWNRNKILALLQQEDCIKKLLMLKQCCRNNNGRIPLKPCWKKHQNTNLLVVTPGPHTMHAVE